MTRIHWAGFVRAIRIPNLRRVDRDVESELQFHLDQRISELVDAGHSVEEATHQAHKEFGDIAASRNELIEIDKRVQASTRRSALLENAWQDLRYALRGLRREPGFALGIVVTLAIAVGANAAVFSLIDPLFFERPPGVIDPSSLRRVYTVNPSAQAASGKHIWRIFSYKEFTGIHNAVENRARVALFVTRDSMPVRLGQDTAVATISFVTSDFLPMTSRASRGRFFSADEDDIGAAVNVAVVSERFAQRRFADVNPVGQVITIGGKAYTIIGVTGGGFAGIEWTAVDVWLPFSTSPLATRDAVAFPMLLRLATGITDTEVGARASLAYARVYADSGKVTPGRSILLGDLSEARAPISGQHEVVIASRLAIVAGIVLLIACANIANLMLSRMVRRRRELAVRLALGISRRRLALQLLMESLTLSVIASAAALLVGVASGSALRSILLPRVEWVEPVMDVRIVYFALALTVVAAVVTAIIPASLAGRVDLTTDLASGRHGDAPSRSLVRHGLIVVQTAFAMMLLVGTALFARSLTALNRVDTGLDLEKLVVATAFFPDEQRHPERGTVFPDIAQRLEQHPSVAAAAWGSTAPLYSWFSFVRLYERGRDTEITTEANPADYAAVSTGFFDVTGTRILRGRGFNENDTRSSEWIMVVGETMANRLWPDEEPIGKCVSVRTRESPCYTVVGVAQDVHAFRRIEDAANRFYIPFSQSPSERSLPSVLLLRTSAGSDPSQVAAMAGAELKKLLPGASITSRDALSMLEPELRPWRLGAQLFGALGVLALIVAAVGLYSVVSFDTRQRTHELGIRIALGASTRTLIRNTLASVVRVTAIGVAVGVIGALLGGRFISALVYGVSPQDTASMVVAAVTLLAVAVLACLAPAIRSTRVDPVIAIRAD